MYNVSYFNLGALELGVGGKPTKVPAWTKGLNDIFAQIKVVVLLSLRKCTAATLLFQRGSRDQRVAIFYDPDPVRNWLKNLVHTLYDLAGVEMFFFNFGLRALEMPRAPRYLDLALPTKHILFEFSEENRIRKKSLFNKT